MANTEKGAGSSPAAPTLALRGRDAPALAAALLVLAATLCFFAWQMVAGAPSSGRPAATFAAFGRDVEDVALTDSNGAAVRWGGLVGAPRALFFGFTHCPEVCPTTMGELAAAIERLGAPARELRIDFVTVDPERDTPEALRDYMQNFGPSFRGYSGTQSEIDRLAKSYRAAYRRTPLEDGGYTMDHTAITYLIDRNGDVVDVVGYNTPPTRLDQQLTAFLSRP